MHSTTLRWLRGKSAAAVGRVLGIALGGAILFAMLQYLREHWPSLAAAAHAPRPAYLLAALAMLFLAYGFNAICWHLIISHRGMATNWRFDALAWCASIVWKYMPGKVWQGASRWHAYHRAHCPWQPFLEAFVLEQFLTLAAAVAIALVFAATLGRQNETTAIAASLIVVVSVLGAALWRRARHRKVQVIASATMRSFHFFLQMAGWLAMQIVALLLLGGGLFLLYAGLFGSADSGLLAPCTAALAIAGLAGILAFFVPSGIGVREAALAWVLSDYLPGSEAVALALACRVWITCGEVLLALTAHGCASLAVTAPAE